MALASSPIVKISTTIHDTWHWDYMEFSKKAITVNI